MATAYEILTGLLGDFRVQLPAAEFREAQGAVMRPAGRALVTGAVAKERTQGDEWSARLAFQVLMPRGAAPGAAEELIQAMAGRARETQPLLSGVERGPAAADRATGCVAAECVFSFCREGSSGGKKTAYPVTIDGQEYTVTGWKVSESGPGGGLTAIGESEPFYYKSGGGFTVELQGLSMESPEELEGFTLRLGSQTAAYTGCRWKSLSAGGGGVLAAGARVAVKEE